MPQFAPLTSNSYIANLKDVLALSELSEGCFTSCKTFDYILVDKSIQHQISGVFHIYTCWVIYLKYNNFYIRTVLRLSNIIQNYGFNKLYNITTICEINIA